MAAHRSHLDSLRERLDYHHTEKQYLQQEIDELRRQLEVEAQRRTHLLVRYARLDQSSRSVGCMSALGNLMTLAGSVLLGVAGAVPRLSDVQKGAVGGAGVVAAICGGLLVFATIGSGWWSRSGNNDPT